MPVNYKRLTILCCLFIPGLLFAQIFVDSDNLTSPQDGQSWETAFNDLNTAIQVALAGDEIWVKQGTYFSTTGLDREVSYRINTAIKLYGGFSGEETNLSQRPQGTYAILTGERGDPGTEEDNAYSVMTISDVDGEVIIDGFEFRDGWANDTMPGTSFSSPKRCGGAVHLNTDSGFGKVYFRNCHFEHNYASYSGGAIYSLNPFGPRLIPYFKQCSFRNNSSGTYGGAISWHELRLDEDAVMIDSCNFDDHYSRNGGSIYAFTYDHRFIISDIAVNHSESRVHGGALFIEIYGKLGRVLLENSFLENCGLIYNNTADQGGGCDFNTPHNPILGESEYIIEVRFTIFRNMYRIDSNDVLSLAQFIDTDGKNSPTLIKDCIIDFSETYFGLAKKASNFTFRNSEFKNSNIAIRSLFKLEFSNVIFYNSYLLFYRNIDNRNLALTNIIFDSGGEKGEPFLRPVDTHILFDHDIEISNFIFNLTPGDDPGYLIYGNQLSLRLNHGLINLPDLEGALFNPDPEEPSSALELNNVILGLNPQFIDQLNFDYHLKSCSPAIDKGDNNAVNSIDLSEDFEGKPRIINDVVDLGIYETDTIFRLALDSVCNIKCGIPNSGEAFIEMSGKELLVYSLSDHAGNMYDDFQGLPAGSYQIILQDGDDCTDSLNFEIGNTESWIIDPVVSYDSVLCFGDQTSSIELTVAGGTPPYTYHWTTGESTPVLEDIGAGNYSVTVIDAESCQYTETFYILQPEELIVVPDITIPTSFNSADGSINITVSGGTPPYQYTWADNLTIEDRTGLVAGLYQLTLTDDNGCEKVLEIELQSAGIQLLQFAVWPNPVQSDKFLNIRISTPIGGNLQYRVINVLGQVFRNGSVELPAGVTTLKEGLPFPDAMYFLELELNGVKKVFTIAVIT